MRKWIGIWLGLMMCAAVAHAQQQPGREEAKRHFAAGEARFKAGDYRSAIAEFQAADALVPSPILSYNQALCHDRLGEVEPALRLYRDYLARRPDAPNRAEVEARIAALGPALEAPAEPPEGAVPPPAAAAPAPEGDGLAAPTPAPTPSAEPRRRPYDEAFARRLPRVSRGEAEQAPPVTPMPPPVVTPMPPPQARAELPPSAAPRPMPAPMPQPEEKPLYKQWWFWVVVGVSAAIVVEVAVSAGDNSSSRAGKPQPAQPASGLTLFKF